MNVAKSYQGSTISFTPATADWGTIVACALMDASTAGNMLVWGTLPTPKPIFNGDTLTIPAAAISITLD